MTRRRLALVAAAALVLICVLLLVLPGWLWHPLGICTGSAVQVRDCRGYNFWSGIFSDVGEVTLAGGIVAMYRRHNCGVTGCWRVAVVKPTAGGDHVCRRHFPGGHQKTHQQVIDDHHAATPRGISQTFSATPTPSGAGPIERFLSAVRKSIG